MNTVQERNLGKQNDRFLLIDIIKGLGMFFVVFAHVNYTPSLLKPIYSFHMPLYFIISGMLFDKNRYSSFSGFLKRRFKTLILPYLAFSIFAIVYAYVSEQIYPDVFDIKQSQYITYFVQIFLSQGSKNFLNVPLWFVLCLFFTEILYYFISKLNIKAIIPICIALSAFGWLLESDLLGFDNSVLPWTIDSALYALSFYAFGNIIFPYFKKFAETIASRKDKIVICLEIILVCGILWAPLMLANGKVSLGSRVLHNGILFFLTGVLGSMMLAAFCIMLGKNRFFAFCGRNSFVIMAVHYVFRKYFVPKVYYLLGYELYNRKIFSETIVPFLIVITLTLLFTYLYAIISKKIRSKIKAC